MRVLCESSSGGGSSGSTIEGRHSARLEQQQGAAQGDACCALWMALGKWAPHVSHLLRMYSAAVFVCV